LYRSIDGTYGNIRIFFISFFWFEKIHRKLDPFADDPCLLPACLGVVQRFIVAADVALVAFRAPRFYFSPGGK
jgi:hypothetical protein